MVQDASEHPEDVLYTFEKSSRRLCSGPAPTPEGLRVQRAHVPRGERAGLPPAPLLTLFGDE